MQVLITNNGPHSPEKWAVATAEHICPIDASAMTEDRLLAAKRLQLAIAEALMPHHAKVQNHERAGLKAKGDDHFDSPLDPSHHLDDAMVAIIGAARGTPWEAHYAKPDVQAAIRQEVGIHFATAQDIERQHHADRHPQHKKAQSYKAMRHAQEI